MSFVPYDELRANFSKALVFGIAGIALFVFFDVNALIAMSPPILAMTFYFLWFRDKSKLKSQVEQFADSFYYLGFLFTLGALAISLIPWAFESASITPESVISKLGIALLTTIIGLGGRVYLTQFQVSEEEAIADIQQRLRDGSRSLAAELDLIVENFQTVRLKATEQLESLVAASGQSLSDSIEGARNDLTESIEKFEETFGKLSSGVDIIESTIADFQSGVAAIAESSSQLKDSFDNAGESVAEVGSKFDSASEGVQAFGKSVADQVPNIEKISGIGTNVEGLSTSIQLLMVVINNAGDALRTTSEQLENVVADTKGRSEVLDEKSKEHGEALAESVRMIAETQEALAEAVKITTAAIEESAGG